MDVTSDGKRFLVKKTAITKLKNSLSVIANWSELVRKK